MLTTEDKAGDDVSRRSAAVESMAVAWDLIADLMGGTARMRSVRERHLPRWPLEDACDYDVRVKTATLFPAYARTVAVLTGKPFSQSITIGDDVPEPIKLCLEDADREGRDVTSFAAPVFADALTYGISGILVDCPPSNGARTLRDEREAGVRPYLVHVKHDDVLGWRSENHDGTTALTQLRLRETVEEPDGLYGTKTIEQVRVLTPGRWEVHRKVKDETTKVETWRMVKAGDTSLDFIPYVPIYGYRKEYMVGVPPMLELAYLNVEHWQSKSDQQTILHVARVPLLLLKCLGATNDVAASPGWGIKTDERDAEVGFVEHSGAAIEAGRLSLLDLEDRMRQVGAELLVIKPGNTTVVQTRSDNEPAMCDLQRITRSLEDGLNLALYYMARFLKLDKGGKVSIYSDFGVSNLSEASAQLVVDMPDKGLLTKSTALREMQRRGVLGADVDVEKEVAEATAEKQAAAQAAMKAMAQAQPNAAGAEAKGGDKGAEAPIPTPVG